ALMRIIRSTENRSGAEMLAPPSFTGPSMRGSGPSIYTAPFGTGMPGMIGAGAGPLALTASGNMVIVAEPGSGLNGERGLWLTVYRLDGTELHKVTSTFHRAAAAPRGPMPAPSRRSESGAGAGDGFAPPPAA